MVVWESYGTLTQTINSRQQGKVPSYKGQSSQQLFVDIVQSRDKCLTPPRVDGLVIVWLIPLSRVLGAECVSPQKGERSSYTEAEMASTSKPVPELTKGELL